MSPRDDRATIYATARQKETEKKAAGGAGRGALMKAGKIVVDLQRFELWTPSLQGWCSTN